MKSLPIASILFVAFLFCKLAKLTAIATWSWWWIFAPVWLPLLIALVLFGIAAYATQVGLKQQKTTVYKFKR